MVAPIERRFVTVPHGVIHCAQAGTGRPVLLLHQTPRSWDEFRDVLPLLGERRRAIAMDTVGYGDSSPLPAGQDSIEAWAAGAVSLLDALGVDRADVVGHHTGGYVATELACAYPERVNALVLSSVSLHTREERLRHASGRAVVDDVDHRLDGSHLLELWRGRAAFYPPDTQLLDRFMIDCLKAGPMAAEGHRVVARYALERRLPLLRGPVGLITATADPHAYPSFARLHAALPGARVVEIEGGMVPLPDQMPERFAEAVAALLDGA